MDLPCKDCSPLKLKDSPNNNLVDFCHYRENRQLGKLDAQIVAFLQRIGYGPQFDNPMLQSSELRIDRETYLKLLEELEGSLRVLAGRVGLSKFPHD